MYSKLLKKHGLLNYIGGSDYNFRTVTATNESIHSDFERLIKQANIKNPLKIYTGHQTHLTNVAYCDGENGEPFIIGRQFQETDGLITDKENIALVVKFADCTPIILFDPVKKIQTIVHSGWRGTVGEISKEALRKMTEEFNSNKKDVLAYVGPSIAQENYEVGAEVYDAFSMNPDRDTFFKPNGEKYLMDMALANTKILLAAGIPEENIEVESATTYSDERLHSARKEGKEYGLNAMVTCMVQ